MLYPNIAAVTLPALFIIIRFSSHIFNMTEFLTNLIELIDDGYGP